ncbi:MAG TPA: 50S ribosomal protein L30 [Cyclobacteriaceae bacterium]|nr:50S ribosomal protein L30 [Cyclobacteriaceae bacterium]
MAKVQITQIRSLIKRTDTTIRTMQALGLGRVNSSNEMELTPQVKGMIKKVNHLISVKEL